MLSLPTLILLLQGAARLDAGDCASRIRATEAFREIDQAFPNALGIRDPRCIRIEFCPDSTCDAFRAKKSDPPERLMEFAYLYVYWFSDYHVLAKWRERREARDIAGRILGGRHYAACHRSEMKEAARCALRLLAKERGISLAFVRYDEGERHESEVAIP